MPIRRIARRDRESGGGPVAFVPPTSDRDMYAARGRLSLQERDKSPVRWSRTQERLAKTRVCSLGDAMIRHPESLKS